MNKIPLNMLPVALRKKIDVSHLTKIEILHKQKSQMFGSTRIFLKKYIPNMRFHNEQLEFNRVLVERVVPLVSIYGPSKKKVAEFEPGIMTPEEILQKIQRINEEIQEASSKQQEGAQGSIKSESV